MHTYIMSSSHTVDWIGLWSCLALAVLRRPMCLQCTWCYLLVY